MKKEYLKPHAEVIEFRPADEIMGDLGDVGNIPGFGGTSTDDWGDYQE